MESENRSQHQDEIELLQNIFIDNFHILKTEPYHSFNIHIIPDASDKPLIKAMIEIDFNSGYPSDKIFDFKISDVNNKAISSQFNELNKKILELYEENKGFPIVYQVTELIKEFCNELDTKLQDQLNVNKKENIHANIISTNSNSSDVLNLKNNLLETRVFTKVTKESYADWFKKFLKDKEIEGGKELKKRKEILGRQSGREFFLKSNTEMDDILKNEEAQEGEEVDYDIQKNQINVDEDLFNADEVNYDEIDFEGEEEEKDWEDFEDEEEEEDDE